MARCDLPMIMNLAERTGAIARCYEKAEAEAASARKALEVFPDSPFREQLCSLAELAVKRTR